MNTFPINPNIPAGPNDPADDQPLMQTNYANIAGWMAVDHIASGSVGAGFHQKVTFNSAPIPLPAALVNPQSVEYTSVGVANPAIQQLYWQNAVQTYALSAVKAFGNFTIGATGNQVLNNGFNVSTIVTSVGPPLIRITLKNNTIFSNTPTVFIFVPLLNTATPYTFNANLLTINVGGFNAGTICNFLILEI